MTLTTLQSRFRRIADQLGSDGVLHITPQHDGTPLAEHHNDRYFYVVTERGSEYERRETHDPEELLSWFVRDLTSELAGNWELTHRIPTQDFRRLRFQKHIELLRTVNETWADLQQAEYADVLAQHPFNDSVGN